ncbi:MAG: hypothetical protein M1596_05890 [Firmicutes bacterium]|nr:hypothetical protein [Bacillota bacterium]
MALRYLSLNFLRTTVIIGLIVSAVVHILQLEVYGIGTSVIIVSGFGVIYAVLAILHGLRHPWAPILSVVFPSIGGILGILRFVFLRPNAGSIIDVVLDVIVIIPVSAVMWSRHTYTSSTSPIHH